MSESQGKGSITSRRRKTGGWFMLQQLRNRQRLLWESPWEILCGPPRNNMLVVTWWLGCRFIRRCLISSAWQLMLTFTWNTGVPLYGSPLAWASSQHGNLRVFKLSPWLVCPPKTGVPANKVVDALFSWPSLTSHSVFLLPLFHSLLMRHKLVEFQRKGSAW